MTSYLSSWFTSRLPEPPTLSLRISPPPEVKDEDDDSQIDDEPPAFPSTNSIQRAGRSDAELMPPPTFLLNGGSTLQLPPSTTTKPKPKSRKVALAPGHSPLDWARLKASGDDLRGGATSLSRITLSELKTHNTKDDAWSAFNGKVYNITPYLPFHPGGEKELMRVAGRDGTKLFAATHGWVNAEFMLDACLVGFLIPDRS